MTIKYTLRYKLTAVFSLQVLTKPREHRSCLYILILFFAIVLQQTCKSGEVDITLVFTERSPLNWTKSTYGYLLAADYACLGIASALLMPLLVRCCHLHDVTLVLIGIVFRIVRVLIISFSGYLFSFRWPTAVRRLSSSPAPSSSSASTSARTRSARPSRSCPLPRRCRMSSVASSSRVSARRRWTYTRLHLLVRCRRLCRCLRRLNLVNR